MKSFIHVHRPCRGDRVDDSVCVGKWQVDSRVTREQYSKVDHGALMKAGSSRDTKTSCIQPTARPRSRPITTSTFNHSHHRTALYSHVKLKGSRWKPEREDKSSSQHSCCWLNRPRWWLSCPSTQHNTPHCSLLGSAKIKQTQRTFQHRSQTSG